MSIEQNYERRFGGVKRLYGDQALINFKKSHIIVVGIGGVGSWVVEALARSGIGKITMIDMDIVSESNINRQLPALSSTIGKDKTKIMMERVKEINPDCDITIIDDFLTKDNLNDLLKDSDYIMDCIDNSRVKAALISWCKSNKNKIIVIGGAGGRIDPSLIKISDLKNTIHDPLLSRTRKILRQKYNFSSNAKRRFNIPSVFSTEHIRYLATDGKISSKKPQKEIGGLSCSGGIGSSVMVTATFGLLATSHVLKRLSK